MGFSSFSADRPPIRDAQALAEFIDRQAAFLMQKGIYEYSRARGGTVCQSSFRESGFQTAVEESRWRAYPLGLAMVAELVEGVLRPHAVDRQSRSSMRSARSSSPSSTAMRFPPRSATQEWSEARIELMRRLQLIGMHAPKRAFDICEPWTETYFNLHADPREAASDRSRRPRRRVAGPDADSHCRSARAGLLACRRRGPGRMDAARVRSAAGRGQCRFRRAISDGFDRAGRVPRTIQPRRGWQTLTACH